MTIYKLLLKDTIEEHILKMQQGKKQLNDMMLEEGSFATGQLNFHDFLMNL